MKHKLINYGKKTKKLWVSAIVVLFVVAVAYSQIVKAQYGTDKVSSGTSYPGNGCLLYTSWASYERWIDVCNICKI